MQGSGQVEATLNYARTCSRDPGAYVSPSTHYQMEVISVQDADFLGSGYRSFKMHGK